MLLTICELAEAHRGLLQENRPVILQSISDKRLNCLASIRKQLGQSVLDSESLSQLLVAVMLLYFLDGFIDCSQQSASTVSHGAGVRAIIDHLGGFSALIHKGQKDMVHMLLSEFASTDLTRALLENREPCFPPEIWLNIESGPVWLEKPSYGVTPAVVFCSVADGILTAVGPECKSGAEPGENAEV